MDADLKALYDLPATTTAQKVEILRLQELRRGTNTLITAAAKDGGPIAPADAYSQILIALLPLYMKPNAATTDEGRLAECQRDAAFLRAACEEAFAVWQRGTEGKAW